MKKIAIYPGSFNPFTVGHLNILEKAEAIFGEGNVIIAVGINPEKKIPIVPANLPMGSTAIGHVGEVDRVATIKGNLPSKKVESFVGFLTDYVWEKEKEGYDVTIVKGLRNGDDLAYETNQLRFMSSLKPDIKIMFLICDSEYSHISSSACRMLEAIRPGASYKYIPKEIESQPTPKEVGAVLSRVYVNKNETDIIKKYSIAPSDYAPNEIYVFEGIYADCLGWIKEQELRTNFSQENHTN